MHQIPIRLFLFSQVKDILRLLFPATTICIYTPTREAK